jgi:acetate kinase
MGLTALDGLMMGSRCGSIDPGVLLYLLQEKKWSIDQVSTLLYQGSGLLGVSGISSDIRELQSSVDPDAIEAIDLFCFIAGKELAALCGILQGCDAIIFTAGIGEKSAIIRKKICERLKWLGVILDEKANTNNSSIISQESSVVVVSVIQTNEEYMIAKHTMDRITGDRL